MTSLRIHFNGFELRAQRIWDRLGGEALVMIPSTQMNLEIIAPNAWNLLPIVYSYTRICIRTHYFQRLCIGQIEASTCAPPGIPRAFDTLAVPGRREFDYQSLPGGGEFELHPRFHVKSLAWRAIMGDAVLEDFRGKDYAFVANWLRGKDLNKLCAVFEVFKF